MIERARSPMLLAEEVPSQLEGAVTSGWIEPGSRAIDIGAGRGQVAAWLAARGFPVVATDISEEAVRLGRADFAHLAPLLEFRTLDASLPAEDLRAGFDFLFDRGCYHVLPTALLPGYLSNVAAWARPGAGFPLMSRRGPAERVPELFGSAFEILESEPIVYARSTGALPRAEAPGTAFRMVRRR
ncbi:MAG: class I SAM-dependent methyltransferase [Alphaproteobacteria bacterium]